MVLADDPALKHRVKQGRGDAAQDAAGKEHPEARDVLREAAQRVAEHVEQRRSFPATAELEKWAGVDGYEARLLCTRVST